jgi:hypothetical protein
MLLLQTGQQQRQPGWRASLKPFCGQGRQWIGARRRVGVKAGGGACERRRAAAALRAASLTVKEVSRQVKPYFGIAQNSNIGEMSSCALQRAGFELCGLG